jgi:hypothetical protein
MTSFIFIYFGIEVRGFDNEGQATLFLFLTPHTTIAGSFSFSNAMRRLLHLAPAQFASHTDFKAGFSSSPVHRSIRHAAALSPSL